MSHGESPILHAYYDQGRLAHLWDERKQPGAAPPLQRLSPPEEEDEQPYMQRERDTLSCFQYISTDGLMSTHPSSPLTSVFKSICMATEEGKTDIDRLTSNDCILDEVGFSFATPMSYRGRRYL